MTDIQTWDYQASVEKMRGLLANGGKEKVSSYMQRRSCGSPNVYLIQSGDNGPVKIGVANSPSQRLAQLQTGNPEKLNLIMVIKGAGIDYEQRLHERFREYHIRDEWFTPEVIDEITNV